MITRWRGVRVPQEVIESPGQRTGKRIIEEPNAEVRRAMIERVGTTPFFELIGNPEAIHRDESGELYRVPLADDREPLVAVHATDPSRGRRYMLRVPPTMRITREAVAWTVGMDAEAWHPFQET